MSDRQVIINRLIQEKWEGTSDLYSTIPFFMRTRLYLGIDSQPWASVYERCEQQDENAVEEANRFYQTLLHGMEEYIKQSKARTPSENTILMMNDQRAILKEFGDDGVRFTKEMATCLENEKQLIFMSQSSSEELCVEDVDDNDRFSDGENDLNLLEMDDLLKTAESNIHAANRVKPQIDSASNANERIQDIIRQANSSEGNSTAQEQMDHFQQLSQEVMSQNTMLQGLRQDLSTHAENVLSSLSELARKSSAYVKQLTQEMRTWRRAEAKRSVKVGPATQGYKLDIKYKKFGHILNTVMDWFSSGQTKVIQEAEEMRNEDRVFVSDIANLQSCFDGILRELFEHNLIISFLSKGVISIENKGSKESPNYCTKKTQPFYTTLKILGGESFPKLCISENEVNLVAEKDLAQRRHTPVTGKDKRSCLICEKVESSNTSEIKFKMEIKNFIRVEQNTVYKQFFRLHCKMTLSLGNSGSDYQLTTFSLPFTFNTGANQILEHNGARMWYFAGVDDIYDCGFTCPDPLPAESVIDMLDSRITYLDTGMDSLTPDSKRRRLTPEERAFLRDRLPVSSDGTVTVQGFLKDKIKKVGTEDSLTFSFYTWFSAVVHTLESLLLRAFLDGVIYGFCSSEMANSILMHPDIPEGTFLLRPSGSNVKNTASEQATSAIIMEIKLRKDDCIAYDSHDRQYTTVPVPLLYKSIRKNTLYGVVKGLQRDKKQLAKFLYGQDRKGHKVEILQGYVTKPEQKLMEGYNVILEKIEQFHLKKFSQHQTRTEVQDNVDDDDSNSQGPNPRKRRYNRIHSSANGQGSTSFQVNVSPHVINESSSGAMNPVFIEMPSSDIKQESFPPMGCPDTSVADQGQRSGTQGNKMPGRLQAKNSSQHPQPNQNERRPVYINIGGYSIDTSNILNNNMPNASMHLENFPVGEDRQIVTGSDCSLSSLGILSSSGADWHTQITNLPTVLNEASEPQKVSRRSSGGNKSDSRKIATGNKSPPAKSPPYLQGQYLDQEPVHSSPAVLVQQNYPNGDLPEFNEYQVTLILSEYMNDGILQQHQQPQQQELSPADSGHYEDVTDEVYTPDQNFMAMPYAI